MQLINTVAWITGAGKRLGRALSLELASRGCNLAIHYGNSAAEAHEVAQVAERLGRHTLVYRANLANVEDILSMGRRIESEFGRLDILINCAANFDRVPLEKITEQDWDRSLDVNLKGSAFCALEAARLMRLKRETLETLLPATDQSIESKSNPSADHFLWGKIINFADWSALRPYRNYLPYMVSKGGVVTLTQVLAQELAPQITVNAIAPGTVLPPPATSPEELTKIIGNIPLRRTGSPADIVSTACFLLEGSDFITGQIICVDGGRSIAQP